MPITRSRALAIALSSLTLNLSLAPASVNAAPTMPPKGTATPLRAVVALIAPFSNSAAGHNACNALTGRVGTCLPDHAPLAVPPGAPHSVQGEWQSDLPLP